MQISKQPHQEDYDTQSNQLKIAIFIYETITQDPTRMALVKFKLPFLKSLDLPFLLKSKSENEQELAIKLCSLLLNGDPELKIVDLVSLDIQARDMINKN